MSKNRKPAVGYISMSTDQPQDRRACQGQNIQTLADRRGYRSVRWYEDHGQPGTESSKRSEYQKLLADAQAGTFAAVLVSEQSRMSREDISDVMMHCKLLRDAGVAIVTCQRGELQFDNLGGFLAAIVDQYGAREESIRLSGRVVSGKRLAIRQGQRQGGALFGYDREILDEAGRVVRRVCGTEKFRKPLGWASRLVPTPDSKAVEAVRFIFEAISDGMSYGSVARGLNRRGCTTLASRRTQRAVQAEISGRTRKAQANVEALEKRLGAVRAKIERGTENLSLASPEDVPGISRLLASWGDEEAKLKEKLQRANGEGGPTAESLTIMARIDQLLDHLSEADREKLASAIRQTVK